VEWQMGGCGQPITVPLRYSFLIILFPWSRTVSLAVVRKYHLWCLEHLLHFLYLVSCRLFLTLLFPSLLLAQHFLPFLKYISQRCCHLGSWAQSCSTVGRLEPAVSNMRHLQPCLRGVCSYHCQHLGSCTQHTCKCKIAL